jgi:hypothetical protein
MMGISNQLIPYKEFVKSTEVFGSRLWLDYHHKKGDKILVN